MLRPYILAETNWKHLHKEKIELAVLPWGATEAHNWHLPYATDNIEADSIGAEATKIAWENGSKVMLLPTIPFGVNTGQSDIYLDINLNPSTQLAILRDIITVLNGQKIHKLLILNSHGGNDFKTMLRELGLEFPQMFLATSNWFQAMNRHDFFELEGDHADEMETSLLLYLKPEFVLPKKEWGEGKEKKHKISEFSENWLWTERKWSKISEDTGVGSPENATSKKGELFFKAVTQKIAKVMTDLCHMDVNNMYG
ncbi:creatininase family protein [Namhaeicola litoreus]|uniref:Creatininase family protein n=1 Tax=Namhaeicola litoreus TaxID=1052145 RepID=A0ABW3Y3N3_9FLAO